MTSYTGKEISSLRIGTVTAVRGRRIDITVDVDKNDSSLIFQGEIISNVSIGSFLVVRRGYAHLVVQVEEEELIESSAWENSDYQRDVDRNTRILKTTLLGEFQKDTSISPFQTHFVSGSQTSPLIGNIAYLASSEQASKIYMKSSSPHADIIIGHLASDQSIPITLDIGVLFSSHIGIFGNTGSGKSYSFTKLYTQLFNKISDQAQNKDRHKESHFILFDFNGEYGSASSENLLCPPELKQVYGPLMQGSRDYPSNMRQIPLLIDVLSSANFWTTILEAAEYTQRPFILKCLHDMNNNRNMAMTLRELIHSFLCTQHTAPSSQYILISFLEDINNLVNETELFDHTFRDVLDEFSDSLDFNNQSGTFTLWANNKRVYPTSASFEANIDDFLERMFTPHFPEHFDLLTRFALIFKFNYMNEVITKSANVSNLLPLMTRFDNRLHTLQKWFKFYKSFNQPIPLLQIINLAEATLDERELIPLIIARTAYDNQKNRSRWSHGQFYLNFIIEEAHAILASTNRRESESWRNTRLDTFEEIIMEGRKFGTFITLLSQRPADISPIITSQLHHYFLHRLVNSVDLDCVKDAVSFLNQKSFQSIPFLPRGTCIISGTACQIPAVVKIDELPEGRRPNNETIDLVKLWVLAPDSSVNAGSTAADSADSQDSESTDEEP